MKQQISFWKLIVRISKYYQRLTSKYYQRKDNQTEEDHFNNIG